MVDPDDEVFEDEPKPDPISVADQAVDGSGNGHEKVRSGLYAEVVNKIENLIKNNFLNLLIS